MKQDKSRGKSEKITLNALVARLVANTPGEFSAAPPRLINSQPKALQQFVKVGLLLLLKNKTADYDIAQLENKGLLSVQVPSFNQCYI